MEIEDLKPLREAAITELKRLQDNGDTEEDHINADRILCDLLGYLGCQDVVDEYEKIEKWFH
jgi:hypothetical protein